MKMSHFNYPLIASFKQNPSVFTENQKRQKQANKQKTLQQTNSRSQRAWTIENTLCSGFGPSNSFFDL